MIVNLGMDFVPPYQDETLKLGEILGLKLHEHAADVEAITDQARKEEKMEQTIERLDDVWSKVEFLFTPHNKSELEEAENTIYLVKLSEEDFEALESDQLVVQTMISSPFLATFQEQVTTWQSDLGLVADVITVLAEIQRSWAYLEPLFLHSEEVKRELPEDATRFADLDVKVILQNKKKICMIIKLFVITMCINIIRIKKTK